MMEEMPFDLERFKAGDVAIDDSGIEMRFSHSNGEGYFVTNNGVSIYSDPSMSHLSVSRNWSMKPSPTESPWVKHDGGENPIPWANLGDYVIKICMGDTHKPFSYDEIIRWDHTGAPNDIIEFRLTNGWIYVAGDGTIPEEIKGATAGEWEWKRRDGLIVKNTSSASFAYNWKHANVSNDIVAVRRVRKEEKREATQCKFCDYPIDNEEGIVGEVCCDVCDENYEYISPMGKNELPVCAVLPETFARTETPQQRLNREAYLRYKAAHPDPKPAPPAMGQDGIEGAIFAALCESMRREWR